MLNQSIQTVAYKPWRNSRRCDNQFGRVHTKCRREKDLCRNTTFCGRETASQEDRDSVHTPTHQQHIPTCSVANGK